MNVRVEIIANRSIQEDLFEQLHAKSLAELHTLLPETQGVGLSGPRRGDHIWPEENFVLITYVDEAEARSIRDVVNELRGRFPDEGITLFAVPAYDL